MSGKVICSGKDCEECKYCTIDDSNVAKIFVHCSMRPNKVYIYGQYICCDDKEKR